MNGIGSSATPLYLLFLATPIIVVKPVIAEELEALADRVLARPEPFAPWSR